MEDKDIMRGIKVELNTYFYNVKYKGREDWKYSFEGCRTDDFGNEICYKILVDKKDRSNISVKIDSVEKEWRGL